MSTAVMPRKIEGVGIEQVSPYVAWRLENPVQVGFNEIMLPGDFVVARSVKSLRYEMQLLLDTVVKLPEAAWIHIRYGRVHVIIILKDEIYDCPGMCLSADKAGRTTQSDVENVRPTPFTAIEATLQQLEVKDIPEDYEVVLGKSYFITNYADGRCLSPFDDHGVPLIDSLMHDGMFLVKGQVVKVVRAFGKYYLYTEGKDSLEIRCDVDIEERPGDSFSEKGLPENVFPLDPDFELCVAVPPKPKRFDS